MYICMYGQRGHLCSVLCKDTQSMLCYDIIIECNKYNVCYVIRQSYAKCTIAHLARPPLLGRIQIWGAFCFLVFVMFLLFVVFVYFCLRGGQFEGNCRLRWGGSTFVSIIYLCCAIIVIGILTTGYTTYNVINIVQNGLSIVKLMIMIGYYSHWYISI